MVFRLKKQIAGLVFILCIIRLSASQMTPGKTGELYHCAFPVSVQIDGDFSDWPAVPWDTVSSKYAYGNPSGDNDCSFAFASVANEDTLFFALQIQDDRKVTGENSGKSVWMDDSFELYLDGQHNAGFRFDDQDLHVTIGRDGTLTGSKGGKKGEARSGEETDIHFVIIETETGWAVEAGLPVFGNNLYVRRNRVIGFNLIVNDDDQPNPGTEHPDGRDHWLSWSKHEHHGFFVNMSHAMPVFFGDLQFKLVDPVRWLPDSDQTKFYWNTSLPLVSYQLPFPIRGEIERIDLDNDGDPDVLRTRTIYNLPVQWIDDDDDMTSDDLSGDTDSDCLMIDRNRDGKYGSYRDLIVDWNDNDEDGKADMQVLVENQAEGFNRLWGGGHYMWSIDTDGDGIFNYIDWDELRLRAWLHYGQSDFLEDYHGRCLFLKMHTAPDKLDDPRLNWENPFLFYDPDKDSHSEMAIRLCDTPFLIKRNDFERKHRQPTRKDIQLTGKIDWASISIDLDNDNQTGSEFDLDMTLHFRGPGFDYMDQVHPFKHMRGLADADSFFLDPQWRQLTELIYPDHESAWDLIFNRGQWEQCWFTYDEDDDCHRWERVELYEPREVFNIGIRQNGIDHHRQSDALGDRGEWDLDNSGKGQLYVGKFDNRLHLYGAEWGAWRVDQIARSYHGFGGGYDGYGRGRYETIPDRFATLKYSDTNKNGFIDKIEYDLNGDKKFEKEINLLSLGIDDRADCIQTDQMEYPDFHELQKKICSEMWENAERAIRVADKFGLNTQWYAQMQEPQSLREKYHFGYWLQFYIYMDLCDHAVRTHQNSLVREIDRAYFGGDWERVL